MNRKRMPLCNHRGRRIVRLRHAWKYFNNLLQGKMIQVQQPGSKLHSYEYQGGVAGHITWPIGRGYAGRNKFCNYRCAIEYAHAHVDVVMEAPHTPKRRETTA